jgi:uncharacterized membrane protein YkoI
MMPFMTQDRHSRSRRLALRAGLALCIPAALSSLGAASAAHADDHAEKAREILAIRAAVQRGELLPLPRIIAAAQAHAPGDVVKTELEAKRGRLIYEVKILTPEGAVREVKLDARTGALLRIEND